MKKIYTLFAILLIASFSFGQNLIVPQIVGKVIPINKTYPVSLTSSKVATDTIFLNDYWSFGQPALYTLTPGYGYIFGTCWDVNYTKMCSAVAQGYIVEQGVGYNIYEVLIWTRVKRQLSANGSFMTVNIQAIDGTSTFQNHTINCPGTTRGTTTVQWDNIDTVLGTYTHAVFTTPVLVDGDYAVVVDFANFYLNNDTIGIPCSADGGATGGYGQEYTWWEYSSPNGDLWLQASYAFPGPPPLNVAIAIFPVVGEMGINDYDYFINGIKLSQNYPNPANNSVIIDYEIEKEGNVTLEIFDITGKNFVVVDNEKKPAGKYSITFNTNNLPGGTYYYSLKTDDNRLTKKMTIIK